MLRKIIEVLDYIYVEVDPKSEEKILRLFRDNIVYEAESGDEFLYLGLYYREKKKYVDSIRCYKEAIKLENKLAFGNLGKIYQMIGDYEKAESFYRQGAELEPNALHLLGTFYQKILKDFDRAGVCFKKSLEQGNLGAIPTIAMFYTFLRPDPNQAEMYYKLAVEKGIPDANAKLCSFYIYQKRFEEAFLLAVESSKERLGEIMDGLTYPISEKNRNKIYDVLETLQFSSRSMIGMNIFYIMQDLVSRKIKIMCEIAYHYKKYNN